MTPLLLALPEVDDHTEAALELAAALGWTVDPQRPDRWQLTGTAWRLRVHVKETWVYELHEGYYRHRFCVLTANLYAVKLTLERVAASCGPRAKRPGQKGAQRARHAARH